jgi:hypothetical protein
VCVQELKSGNVMLELRLHSASIRHVEWNAEARVLVTVDAASRAIATRLLLAGERNSNDTKGAWGQAEQLFNRRGTTAVAQALIRPDGAAVLLSTQLGEELWQLGDDMTRTSEHSQQGAARWLQHPTDKMRLLLLSGGNSLALYLWDGLRRDPAVMADVPIVLPPGFADLVPSNSWVSRTDIGTVWQAMALPAPQSSSTAILMLDAASLLKYQYQDQEAAAVAVAAASRPGPLAITLAVRRLARPGAKAIVHLTRSSVFFLTRSGWLCSADIASVTSAKSYTRHLFIPPSWRNAGELLLAMASKNSVAVAYRDDLIVIHKFTEFEHVVPWLE